MTDRLRVLIVTPWGEALGGAETMLTDLLDHGRAEIDASVVFMSPGTFPAVVAGLGHRTVVIDGGRLRDIRTLLTSIRRLAAVIRAGDFDVLVAWSAKSQLYLSPAAWVAGRTRHVLWVQHMVPSGVWIERIATLLPAAAVICSSRDAAPSQEARWPHRRTHVVRPGVEAPQAAPKRTAAAGPTRVGVVGRLQPWKGQHEVIAAIGALRDEGFDVELDVVGGEAFGRSPGYERQLHDLVSRLNLVHFVHFHGQVDDPGPLLAAMDILVSASDPEPFGIVLLEAMAHGLPVVAVDAGGPREIVEHSVTGLLVPSGRAEDLAGGLRQFVEDPTWRARAGRAGLERLREHFSAARMVQDAGVALRAHAR